MIKICEICGKPYNAIGGTKTCSLACRNKHRVMKYEERRAKKRQTNENLLVAKTTLCWKCRKAIGKCSWSRSLTPVEGWEVKVIKVKGNFYTGEILNSYIVKECPEFEKDERR